MKLLTWIGEKGEFCLGVLEGKEVIDLGEWPVDPEEGIGRFLQEEGKTDGKPRRPFNGLKLGPPIPRPQKIVCVGQSYRQHCIEQNVPIPTKPILFAKFPSALAGCGAPIEKPSETEKLDYEAELAVVIGRRARNVSETEVSDCILGYMNFNDVTARDVQYGEKQWVRGKSFDTFAPCGPYIATKDEISDPQNLRIRCRVNGETRQDSNTSDLVFRIPWLVSYLSRTMTLFPGDILATGTPSGVGVFRDPPVFLQPGDRVEVEIDRLGILSNSVTAG